MKYVKMFDFENYDGWLIQMLTSLSLVVYDFFYVGKQASYLCFILSSFSSAGPLLFL